MHNHTITEKVLLKMILPIYAIINTEYFEIYNQSNQFQDVEMTFKDGSSIIENPGNALYLADKIVSTNNPDIEIQIFQQVIGETIMRKFESNEEYLILRYTIGENGRITEMSFIFMEDSGFTEIAPDIFYQIEQQLKSKVRYTLKEEASKYNIIKIQLHIESWF